MRRTLIVVVAAVMALAGLQPAVADQPQPQFSQFSLPAPVTAHGDAIALYSGPDGTVWERDSAGHAGLVADDGTVTEYPVSGLGQPNGQDATPAAVAADGSLWLGRPHGLTRVTKAGSQTQFATTGDPQWIVPIAAGGVWFAASGVVGRVAAGGQVQEYPTAHPAASIRDLALASDGAVWFLQSDSGSGLSVVGRVGADGTLIEVFYSAASRRLAAMPAGDMWVATDVYSSTGTVYSPQVTVKQTGAAIPMTAHLADKQGFYWYYLPSSPLLAHVSADNPSGWSINAGGIGAYRQADAVKGIWAVNPSTRKASWLYDDPAETGHTNVTSFDTPQLAVGSEPVVPTADGGIWLLRADGALERLRTDGTRATFSVPSEPSANSIAADQDGNLWFAGASHEIAVMSPSGSVRQFPTPSTPGHLTLGPDAKIWYGTVHDGQGYVVKVESTGQATEFTASEAVTDSPPVPVAGPDGRVWWSVNRKMFATTVAGVTTKVADNVADWSWGLNLTPSSDRIWWSDWSRVSNIDTAGTLRQTSNSMAYPAIAGTRQGGGVWVATNTETGFDEPSPIVAFGPDAQRIPTPGESLEAYGLLGSTPGDGVVVKVLTVDGDPAVQLLRDCGLTDWPQVERVITAADGRVWAVTSAGLSLMGPSGVMDEFSRAGLVDAEAATDDQGLWFAKGSTVTRVTILGVGQVADWSCGAVPKPSDPPTATPGPTGTRPTPPGSGPTAPATTVPAGVGQPRVVRKGGAVVVVRWHKVVGATSYRVRVSKPGGKKWQAWRSQPGTSLRLQGLKRKIYRIQIVAVGRAGESPVRTVTVGKK